MLNLAQRGNEWKVKTKKGKVAVSCDSYFWRIGYSKVLKINLPPESLFHIIAKRGLTLAGSGNYLLNHFGNHMTNASTWHLYMKQSCKGRGDICHKHLAVGA